LQTRNFRKTNLPKWMSISEHGRAFQKLKKCFLALRVSLWEKIKDVSEEKSLGKGPEDLPGKN
jgi:hypothetical protein